MDSASRRTALREIAEGLEQIDVEVYRQHDRDPLEPVIGYGPQQARVALFGRDPGRDEVQHQMPFIGAGGQKVRSALYRHLYQKELPDFDASVEVGRFLYWANTVPYKPIGNKAWPMSVKRRFQPLLSDLLVSEWCGSEVITLGREAFLWFGINQTREERQRLEAFWSSSDRFESSLEVTLTAIDGSERSLRLHPLPHPSPLNATWYKRFPTLLSKRLQKLQIAADNWSM